MVCMALTVQEHRSYTPVSSVLFPLVSPLGSVGYEWVKIHRSKVERYVAGSVRRV